MRLLCPYCHEDIQRMGEDLIDYCPGCEVVTERETLVLTEEAAEALFRRGEASV